MCHSFTYMGPPTEEQVFAVYRGFLDGIKEYVKSIET